MIQKRILTAIAIPVIAGVARFAATKLRSRGKSGLANKIDEAANLVSPKGGRRKKKRGLLRRR